MSGDLEAKSHRWRDKLQGIQDKLWVDPPDPSHLYHYSNLDGIMGILSNGKIWLSDILTMQDKFDGTYWIELFREILNRNIVPSWLKKSFESGKLGSGTDWYMYVACFSPRSELENQWKDYADSGKGCAIELPFHVVKANADGGRDYAWTPMTYDQSEQIAKAEKTIQEAISLCGNESMTPAEAKRCWMDASFSFLTCGTRFKHPRYSGEHEWRLSAVEQAGTVRNTDPESTQQFRTCSWS